MNPSRTHVIILAAGVGRRLEGFNEDLPKTFLEIEGKKLIHYILDQLAERGFEKVTIVIGYKKDLFIETLGSSYRGLELTYVVSKDYATTGHGNSIFQTRSVWEKEKLPVLLIHSDIFYDPEILDRVMASPDASVTGVDGDYERVSGEEVAVEGADGRITGMEKGLEKSDSVVGHCIGVTRWSAEFMDRFYPFMDDFFAQHGNDFNWEPVFHAFIQDRSVRMHYTDCTGLPWININRREDFLKAKGELFSRIYHQHGQPRQ